MRARVLFFVLLLAGIVLTYWRDPNLYRYPVAAYEDGHDMFGFYYNHPEPGAILRFYNGYLSLVPNAAGYLVARMPTERIPLLLSLFPLSVAAIGFAWFVGRLSVPAQRVTVPLGVVLVLSLVAQPSMAVVKTPLWDNGVAEMADLAEMFPPEAVLLVSPELAGVQAQAALTFWYGFGGVALSPSYAVEGLAEDQVVRWLRGGRDVFLLCATSDLHFAGSSLSLAEHGSDEVELRTLAASSWLPHRTMARQVRITAYRFGLDLTPKTHVDVGSHVSDALFLLTGFYGAESDAAAGRYRWTGANASIEIPASRRVALVLQGARPPGIAPAVVSIRANGELILEGATVSDQPMRVDLDLGDLDLNGPVTIGIESSTFNPRQVGLSDDSRELGVRVYRADLER